MNLAQTFTEWSLLIRGRKLLGSRRNVMSSDSKNLFIPTRRFCGLYTIHNVVMMAWEDALWWEFWRIIFCCTMKRYFFLDRLSTNLTEKISRKLPGGISQKTRTCLHCFGLLSCYVTYWTVILFTLLRTKTWYEICIAFCTTWGHSKNKIGRPVSTEISDLLTRFMIGNQCTCDHLTQKFPGGPVKSRRFPFPGGFLNSRDFQNL